MNKIIIALVLIILCVFSCREKTTLKNKYYYVRVYFQMGDTKIDTIKSDKIQYHYFEDSLFFKTKIVLNNKVHELRKYSNVHHAPMDGAHVVYELDSFGVIFYSSLDWISREKLYSTNDSINNIISYCLEEALIKSELSGMHLYNKVREKRNAF